MAPMAHPSALSEAARRAFPVVCAQHASTSPACEMKPATSCSKHRRCMGEIGWDGNSAQELGADALPLLSRHHNTRRTISDRDQSSYPCPSKLSIGLAS